MQVTVERLPKGQAKLRFELDPIDMFPHLTVATARLSSKTAFPGFRPGKAPYDAVAKRLGEGAIWEEALEDAVRTSYVAAIKEHKLSTMGQPKVSVEKIAPGNPVEYTATVSLLPDVKLPPLDTLKAKKKVEPVKDDEVNRTIEELREVLVEEKPVDRAAALGDKVEIDVDVSVDGVSIEGGKSRKHPAVLGKGSFIPGFEDQVVGVTKGQTKEFELAFPKQYYAKHLAGKKAMFKVTVQTIAERNLPALDDIFAKKVAGVDTVDALRKKIASNLTDEHAEKAEREYEAAFITELADRSTFGEMPELLTENETERMLAEIKQDIDTRGMKFADYLSSMKKDEATFRKELQPGALKRAKSSLVIREIAKNEGIAVTEKEIDDEVQNAVASAKDEQQVSNLRTDDFRDYVESVLINRKAIELIKSKQSVAV